MPFKEQIALLQYEWQIVFITISIKVSPQSYYLTFGAHFKISN